MRARRQSARGTRARDRTAKKKLDGLCLGFYCSGVLRDDAIGTRAAGVERLGG